VGIVVAAGSQVDDRPSVTRLRKHTLGPCCEDGPFAFSHSGLGAVHVTSEGEIDRLRDVGRCDVEGLARFDAEAEPFVDVGTNRHECAEMHRRERANGQ
jgi:hypothetical protein